MHDPSFTPGFSAVFVGAVHNLRGSHTVDGGIVFTDHPHWHARLMAQSLSFLQMMELL